MYWLTGCSTVYIQLQPIPSNDCNFCRTQIATLVVGQLHSGWVGQLQLPWMASCSFVCIPVPTQPVSRLHLQTYTNCNSGARPVVTRVIDQLHSMQQVHKPSLTLRSTRQARPQETLSNSGGLVGPVAQTRRAGWPGVHSVKRVHPTRERELRDVRSVASGERETYETPTVSRAP